MFCIIYLLGKVGIDRSTEYRGWPAPSWYDSAEHFMVGFGKPPVVDVTDVDARGIGIGVAECTGDDSKVDIGVVCNARPCVTNNV